MPSCPEGAALCFSGKGWLSISQAGQVEERHDAWVPCRCTGGGCRAGTEFGGQGDEGAAQAQNSGDFHMLCLENGQNLVHHCMR